ncbi:hypothetical protein BKA70DRAFT_1235297 [Coprinopsis sp. MPI-PUGE-AT-0042]|nr:hypothetical protein BKA70DRAFT_1235297 [Coprinopsis sp. MPI-PUGE-AT-0042]
MSLLPLRYCPCPFNLPESALFCYQVGRYTQALFQCKWNPEIPRPRNPGFSVQLRCELQQIVDVVNAALSNEHEAPFSLVELADAVPDQAMMTPEQRKDLEATFDGEDIPEQDSVMVYTPGVWKDAKATAATDAEEGYFFKTSPDNWWTHPNLYTPFTYAPWPTGYVALAGSAAPSKPIADPSGAVLKYLKEMNESTSVLAAITALIQPQIFEAGFQVVEGIFQGTILSRLPDYTKSCIERWASPFSTLTLISGRETPLNRDHHCPNDAYPIMATIGDYSDARLASHLLGRTFNYESGTVVAGSPALEFGISTTNGPRLDIIGTFRRSAISRCNLYHQSEATTHSTLRAFFYTDMDGA